MFLCCCLHSCSRLLTLVYLWMHRENPAVLWGMSRHPGEKKSCKHQLFIQTLDKITVVLCEFCVRANTQVCVLLCWSSFSSPNLHIKQISSCFFFFFLLTNAKLVRISLVVSLKCSLKKANSQKLILSAAEHRVESWRMFVKRFTVLAKTYLGQIVLINAKWFYFILVKIFL